MEYSIVLAISALLLLGLSSCFAKIPNEKLGALPVMVYRGVFNVLILGTILSFNFSASLPLKYLLIGLLVSILGFFPLFFFFKSLEIGKAGVVSPISASYTLLTVLLAVVFFKESLNWLQIMAIFLAFCGIILISINFKDFKSSHLFEKASGIGYALLAALTWGIYFFLIRIPTEHLGTYFMSFLVEIVILFGSIIALLLSRKKVFPPISKSNLSSIFFVSLTISAGVLFYYQALNTGSVSIVSAIGSSTPLIVTIYGAIFLKERLRIQQYFGMVLILASIIGLSVL